MNIGIVFCSFLQTTFLDSHLEMSSSYLKEIYLFRITDVIHLLAFVFLSFCLLHGNNAVEVGSKHYSNVIKNNWTSGIC